MSESASESLTIIDKILACQDLTVVLNNRYEEAYVENLHLSTIVVWQNQFIGKIKNVHSGAGLPNIEARHAVAYAYNNFCPVVSCCNLETQKMRVYSAYAYSNIAFTCRRPHQKIWTSEQPEALDNLNNSVDRGGKLKALIHADDGYTYIMAIQALHVDEKNNTFTAETEYDGIPVLFKEKQSMTNFGAQLDAKIPRCTAPNYPSGVFKGPTPFFSLFFIISVNGVQHCRLVTGHSESGSSVHKTAFAYKKVEIWSDSAQ